MDVSCPHIKWSPYRGLDIRDLDDLIRERRLRWYGHVECSSGEINRVRTMPIPGKRGPGRPAMTWDELVNKDLKGLRPAMPRTEHSGERPWGKYLRGTDNWRLPHFVGARAHEARGLPRMRPAYPRTRSSIKTKPDLIDWLIWLSTWTKYFKYFQVLSLKWLFWAIIDRQYSAWSICISFRYCIDKKQNQ